MRLSDAERRAYHENGFVMNPGVLTRDDVRDLNDLIDRLVAGAEASGDPSKLVDYERAAAGELPVVRRMFNPFEQDAKFRSLAVDPRILGKVETLIGPDIALQHSKLNMKADTVGAPVEWHQDLPYFPHTNADLVGVLIYLDDATAENGCLRVLPRQNHRYFDHGLADGSFAGMITEPIDDQFSESVALEGRAGSVLFLHPLTPHCSPANESNRRRRLLIFEYRAADAFPIFNGNQLVAVEACAHHLSGAKARRARFGGPPPAIYRPRGQPRSLFELQAASRAELATS